MTESTTKMQLPKKLSKLFKWLHMFFMVFIAGGVLIFVGSGLTLSSDNIMFNVEEPLTVGEGVFILGGLLWYLGIFPSIVLFCIFSYRAIKNLTIFGVKGIEMKPGWAVGWYFVPIANLWKPYEAMIDMWIGSIYPDDPYSDTPKTMPWWWGCWIITNISSNLANRLAADASVVENYKTNVPLYKISTMLDMVSAVTGIIAAWLIINILKSIAEAQDLRIQGATVIGS